jgi:beta-glucanase (GH16 family)
MSNHKVTARNHVSNLIPLLFFLLPALLGAVGCASAPAATPTPAPTPTPDWVRPGWELVWSDEFDGTEINSEYWTHEVGGDGWGNGENQYYTDAPTNSFIEDGNLVIEAVEENFSGKLWTSARLSSQEKVAVQYGRVEARARIPVGQGLWPAFWMLGTDIDEVGWPFAGEIDIMENIGSEPNIIHGTVHGPGYFGANGVGNAKTLPAGERYTDNFHVFAIEWEEDEIRWYMDDELYHKITPNTVPGEWVYNHEFYLILNLAVGGEWPGYPGRDTEFPARFEVDYVRVYTAVEE